MLDGYCNTVSSDARPCLPLVIAIDTVYLNQIGFCDVFALLRCMSIKFHRTFGSMRLGQAEGSGEVEYRVPLAGWRLQLEQKSCSPLKLQFRQGRKKKDSKKKEEERKEDNAALIRGGIYVSFGVYFRIGIDQAARHARRRFQIQKSSVARIASILSALLGGSKREDSESVSRYA